MERLVRLRKPARAVVLNAVVNIEAEVNKVKPDLRKLRVLTEQLDESVEKIVELDQNIMTAMIDDDCDDDVVDQENTEVIEFRNKARFARIKAEEAWQIPVEIKNDVGSTTGSDQRTRSFKLPTIELQKFGGDLKEWLGFWSQFQKIHEDDSLHATDKFQYLIQAMQSGTEAKDIVSSYPAIAENYPKAVEALKDRYGRDSLLLQVYIRELLKLVISNVSQKEKVPLDKMYIKLESHLRALGTLNLATADPATWLFPLVESSLPEDTLRAWQRSDLSKKDGQMVNPPKSCLDYLMEFIKHEVQSEQQIKLAKYGFQEEAEKPNKKSTSYRAEKFRSREESNIPTAAGLFSGKVSECVFCGKSNHASQECFKAQSMTMEEKTNKVKESKGCFICFRQGHGSKMCKVPVRCSICSKKHYPLMCPELATIKRNQNTEISQTADRVKNIHVDNRQPETSAAQANVHCQESILLKTLMVRLSVSAEKELVARLLFDDGSQKSYVTKGAAFKIISSPISSQMCRNVLFDGSVTPYEHVDKHEITVTSLNGKNKVKLILSAKSTIGGRIPSVPNGPWIEELKQMGITITDRSQSKIVPDIDILIGSDYWGSLMTGKIVHLKNGLIAMESVFGWTLSGPVSRPRDNIGMGSVSMFLAEENLSKLWNLEAIGIKDPIDKMTQDQEESTAMEMFKKTVTRNEDGRYCVKLPWINGRQVLPDNRNIAESMLMSTTKKLDAKGQFKDCDDVIKAWLMEEIIEEAHDESDEGNHHYLPHHPVFKESPTTPVRPVFNASYKVGRNPSLNECLYKGPNFIELLPSVLMRFREKSIGVLSDIRKAFQMIEVHPEDRDYLRFLWWEDSAKKKIKVYRHTRVVFGVNCSPFLLAAVLNLHLSSVNENRKEIAMRLQKALYVDNRVTSVENYDEYEEFKAVSTAIMAEAKMELRQWECTLGEKSRIGLSSDGCGLDFNKSSILKCSVPIATTNVLGMIWDKEKDTLCVDNKVKDSSIAFTKRGILSTLHKIYDNVGFTCPALLQPKIILQSAWEKKIDWDKELPMESTVLFKKWYEEIEYLEQIKIPRHHQLNNPDKKELHCFTDASQEAYAAVVFLRTEKEGRVMVQLVQAKSRVSPINKPTIPRLELMGCLIGTRLVNSVKEALNLQQVATQYWSDSTTAIAWIKRNDEWGTFVGNRVKQILQFSNANQWRHVPGTMNPADLPSRGCTPKELLHSKWWEGPSWLKEDEDTWPSSSPEVNEEEISKEKKKTTAAMTVTSQTGWYEPKFSSYLKNVKVIAWVKRFCHNIKLRKVQIVSRILVKYLSIQEIRAAEVEMIKLIQAEGAEELANNKKLPVEMKNGIMCVKTSLLNREDKEEFKWPTLLPKSHLLVDQLIREAHIQNCHAGTQFLMGKLREKYWITQARRTITKVIRGCVRCRRFQSKNLEVEAAALPEKRVTSGEVFDTTGVDLAGPLHLREGTKVWIVLYTCAVYRSVHLDLVTSLSTEAFISSLERFINQYGRPNTIYSDNGTNFVGASNLFKTLDWEKIESSSLAKRITWIFNPPTAAWWGGWWERLVRTVKDLLKRMLGKAKLNYDDLRTCLTAVASTINGRPLTTVSEDPDDFQPLTPAMFMTITRNASFPEGCKINQKDLQGQYKKCKMLQQQLQARFRKEYLSLLVRRVKSTKKQDVGVGHIVLVGADNKKRYEWPLGRVVQLMPGKDEKVRVAKVQTAKGFLVRPLQRLYPLEIPVPEEKPLVPILEKKTEVLPKIVPEPAEEKAVIETRVGRKIKKPSRYGVWSY